MFDEELIVIPNPPYSETVPTQITYRSNVPTTEGHYFLELVKAMSVQTLNASDDEESDNPFSTFSPQEVVKRAHLAAQEAFKLMDQSGWILKGKSMDELNKIYGDRNG
jgi:hypothetical protein